MILTGWEIRKESDDTYKAVERRTGRDGFGMSINELTGRTLKGSLEEIHAQLISQGMSPSKIVPFRGPTVIEFWW